MMQGTGEGLSRVDFARRLVARMSQLLQRF
jgi:hypothetical protein